MKNKKILFIQRDLKSGGAQRAMAYIAQLLSNDSFECYIYTYNASFPEIPLSSNIRFIPEKKPQGDSFLGKYIHPIFSTKRVIDELKPECIIAFTPSPCVAAIFSSKLSHQVCPVIVCERSDPFFENNIRFRVLRYFYRFANYGIFQTEESRDYFKQMTNKSSVIPNPAKPLSIEADAFENRNDAIAFVARLDIVQKRQDLMLKAMELINKQYPNMRLLFYGEGQDEAKLKEMTIALNLSKIVEFKGNIENVANEVSKAKFLVLTSDFEGIPNVIVEAMSMGLTVISTDTSPGGARFLISDGINGRIVKREDYVEIANLVIYYMNNANEANKLGEEAKKISDKLSPNKIKNEWIDVINNLIENAKD